MLCVANVHLSDWPLNHARDVDPNNERVRGLLRSGFIVPLTLPQAAPPTPPPDPGGGMVMVAPDPPIIIDEAPDEPEPPAKKRK